MDNGCPQMMNIDAECTCERTQLAMALAALAAAEARVARLEAALKHYADPKSYHGTVDYDGMGRVHITNWALGDCGLAARQALAPTEAPP